MTYLLGVLAAVAYGTNWVLQQHEAAAAPTDLERHPVRLLECLLRRPLWLAGLAALAAGSALQEAAIATGSLSQTESLLIFDLVWALFLGRLVYRRRHGKSQWLGAFAVCAGLAVLLLIGSPSTGRGMGDLGGWTLVLALAAGVVAGAAAVSWRWAGAVRAVACSVAAGLLFGVSDALSKAAFDAHTLGGALARWQIYACVVTAIVALMFSQIAYNAARLSVSLPGLAVGEPLAGLAVGVLVLHVHFRLGAGPLAAEAVAAAVLVLGAVHVARAAAAHERARRRPHVGLPYPTGVRRDRAEAHHRGLRARAAASRLVGSLPGPPPTPRRSPAP